ncbi:Meiotic activator RIM4 [Tolypocladium ophioglossoides CBS 100239]|uniref:Meiotic activator RIM4 n=1 Tax=Tolypocladium ophioglossoides (strain CBS 100239) TaxID=1163406 RepID=A0A0L0N8M8_TOLOC|nr:Meiotic activator RIM4 [Tolypocladium ophioglossoides CBS 100239]
MPPACQKPERKPSLGQGLNLHSMRKAASCESLSMDNLALSDDERYRGGARCETTRDVSPGPKTRAQDKKPASEDGTPISTRSSNFLVGSSEDDDVFTDGSNDGFHAAPNPREAKEVAVYQDSGDRADPQTMYAGSSCMFVANLPQHFSDRLLEEEVTKAFSQFGIVFVKIKRDGRGMPFAFCQYTNDVDARNAMIKGKGTVILERPCRTEMARAHTSFVVYKLSGQRIRLSEARDLLRRLGEVAKTEYLNEGLRVIARLPQAVIATYKMYDPRRDPLRTFANDPTFCVKIYDPKALSGQGSASNAPREGGFLKQYDRDRRSAYVGNLPPSMTRDVLKSLASSCGEVLDVQLHLKEVQGGGGQKTCFAFLEFTRPDAPNELVEAMVCSKNNTEIDGYRIRVERKQSRPIETPRRVLPQAGDTHERFSGRRPRVGSFELEKPSGGRFGTPPGSMGWQSRRAPYASNSFTPGRSRYPRPSILGSGASPAGSIFEPVMPAFAASPDGFAGPCQIGSAAAGLSAKKSVDFDLSHRSESCSSVNSVSGPEDAYVTSKPTTPKAAGTTATSSAKKASASRKVEAPAPPTAMPWMPPYPPFGYPYMGAPMTPQTNPGFMYPGYMQPPMYHPMYDMYGNMLMSPTHMMPSFGAPVSNETPARPDDDKASDGSGEKPDTNHFKGKGRAY